MRLITPCQAGAIKSWGSIPMCMGPPLHQNITVSTAWVYPHVYGATNKIRTSRECVQGLSPCVWGHREATYFTSLLRGSIPMCMGPPIIMGGGWGLGGVCAHVCGGG